MSKRNSHFFALRPANGATAEMRRFRDAEGLAGTAIRDGHLHVTLLWFGYDPLDATGLVSGARKVAGTIVAGPFRVMFDQLIGSETSLLLKPSEPLEHLQSFQHRLATALARRGLRAGAGWRFSPHVTLRRGPGDGGMRAVDPIAWTVTEFALVHSLGGHTRHETVGTWPLDG